MQGLVSHLVPPDTQPLSRGERLMRQNDIIRRFGEDMQLTDVEKRDLKYYMNMENVLSLSFVFLWMPLSIAFIAKYKQDPVKNAALRVRALSIYAIQLPVLFYISFKKNQTMGNLQKKYLNDLSDYEIRNFEKLFSQLRAQQQQQPQIFG